MFVALLFACLAIDVVTPAWAHRGDRLFPIPQLTDEDVARLDLHDGSVQDWLDIVGDPLVRSADFTVGSGGAPDPGSFAFRGWVAWHDDPDRLYLAVEAADDIYINRYEPGSDWPNFVMFQHDAYVGFAVDGDHSGGFYMPAAGLEEGWVRRMSEPAQSFEIIGGSDPVIHIEDQYFYYDSFARQLPYADAGGGVFGQSPTIWAAEAYVTPFDHLDLRDPPASRLSDLFPGKVVGFALRLNDTDLSPMFKPVSHYLPERWGMWWISVGVSAARNASAESFADGLLLGAGQRQIDPGAGPVADTWARIKAAFVPAPAGTRGP